MSKITQARSEEISSKLIENQEHLAQWVKESGGPLDLAVAFWGKGAVKELGLTRNREIRVLLELQSGATNPEELKILQGLRHVEVKHLPRLHAKAYISETDAIIGSTNASANGLGTEGTESRRWHELALHTTDATTVKAAKAWFESKWSSAMPIKPSDLKMLQSAWEKRRKIRPKVRTNARDVLDAALNNPEEFRNRGLFVVVSASPWDAKGKADAKDYKKKHGHQALGWQNWKSIPKDATLICFTEYNAGMFQWDDPNVCYSPAKLNIHASLVLVTETNLDDALRPGSIKRWAKALTVVKATMPAARWRKDHGMCMDLGEFAEAVNSNRAL